MEAKSSGLPRGLGGAAVFILSLLSSGVVLTQGIPPSVFSTGRIPIELIEQLPFFEISTDPAVEVLKLGYYGQDNRDYAVYTLYGDLHLERVRRIHSTESETTTVQLQFGRARRLVRLALLFGLVETDQTELSLKVREAGIARSRRRQLPGQEPPLPAPPPADSARYNLDIALSSFADFGPRTNKLVIFGLDNRAEIYPNIVELRGWLLLGRQVNQLFEEK